MSKELEICVTGQVEGTSGYAQHTRSLAMALNDRDDCKVSISAPVQQGWEKRVPGKIFQMMSGADYKLKNNICIQMPNQWCFTKEMRPERFVGFGVFEGTETPKHWADCANDDGVNMVFVPSKHTKDAFVKAGAKEEKFRIIPHGVDLDIFKPSVPVPADYPAGKEKGFTFIYVGGWADGVNDRKGLDILLKAYTEEFGKDEDVGLIAKLNLAYTRPGWEVHNEIGKLNLKPQAERAEFTIIGAKSSGLPYSIEEMASIYCMGDVNVCPTKGEAFGMNFLEAMACGLPNIYTNFGGQTDFCNEENGWSLGYSLKPATGGWLYEQCKWGVPEVQDLRGRLRYCFEHQDEVKKKGKKAQYDAKNWTWKKSAEKVVKVLS